MYLIFYFSNPLTFFLKKKEGLKIETIMIQKEKIYSSLIRNFFTGWGKIQPK